MPHRQPGSQRSGSALANKKACPIPLDDLELANVDPAPTSLEVLDCRLDGRFDATFHAPANLAELLNVDFLDRLVMPLVLRASPEAPRGFWTNPKGQCGQGPAKHDDMLGLHRAIFRMETGVIPMKGTA